MKNIVCAGGVLGVLVAIWTFVMGFTGWYKHPALLNLFWIVILIEIVVLVWGLRGTAAEGRAYWSQVGAGTLMSVIGAVIIFCGSILFTAVVFPHYFEELRAMGAEIMRAKGLTADQIARQQAAEAPYQTSVINALMGVVGTVVTGLVVSLIAAAFLRHRPSGASRLGTA